jgi:L-arabinose transport system substrate-binding protein
MADGEHYFFLNKLGDLSWFIEEVDGARVEAERLGADFTSQNLGSDSNLAISAMETAIAAGASGIAIVVPDQSIGPAVMRMAAEAGIPLVAVDDGIVNADGVAAPFVGFDATSIGRQVGDALAAQAADEGWNLADGSTRLLSVEVQTLSVCMDRTDNAIDVLMAEGLTEDSIVHVPYDPGTQDVAQSAVSQILVAYPTTENWLISACNDEGIVGAVRALEQAGFGAAEVAGVGIGGQLACEEFAKDIATGVRGTVYVDSRVHGETAIRLLHENVTEGTSIPARTIVDGVFVSRDNAAEYCS